MPYLYKRRSAASVKDGSGRSPGQPTRVALVPLPASEIEQAVLQQIHATLQQPEMIIAVWRAAQTCQAAQPDEKLDEAQAVVAMRQMGQVWEQLFPVEQQRIAQLLIERCNCTKRGWTLCGERTAEFACAAGAARRGALDWEEQRRAFGFKAR